MKLGHKILDSLWEAATLWHDGGSYWWTQDDEDTIRFASKEDLKGTGKSIEFAFLDLSNNVLYNKTEYKNKYLKAKKDIKRRYNVEKESEYTNM